MAYRILASKLGYSCPQSSWDEAMKWKLDCIGADAGSMDFGPYYLGSGACYFPPQSLRHDFSMLLTAALRQDCPLLIGTLGTTGARRQMEVMLAFIKEILAEHGVRDLPVAVISSDVDAKLLLGHVDALRPLGRMPRLTEEAVAKSVMVSQMGVAPYITALEEGARIVLAGRSCDVAIFAADPIRRGIDPGLAFQAAHILECGAIACDPGSASDYLIAEFRDDGGVVFTPPNQDRKATIYSISAHALYEENHPSLQFYPEGVLDMRTTRYFQDGERSAGFREPAFYTSPLSVKIEGSMPVGKRRLSLFALAADPASLPAHLREGRLIYGYNAVETTPVPAGEREIGIVIRVTAKEAEQAAALASILKGFLLHLGYPGRITTAGNLAFPLSPGEFSPETADDTHTTLVVAGSREPLFIDQTDTLFAMVRNLAQMDYPELAAACQAEFLVFDAKTPLMLVDTIAATDEEAIRLHGQALAELAPYRAKDDFAALNVPLGETSVWSVYHLWNDQTAIAASLFPVRLYSVSGRDWTLNKELQPRYAPLGTPAPGPLDERAIDVIEDRPLASQPRAMRPLREMVKVLRSKDAGINTITYDIFFKTPEDYAQALASGVFHKKAVAARLGIAEEDMLGTYRADACYAIKIARFRAMISGTPGSPDVFGAQQHMRIETMQVPVY